MGAAARLRCFGTRISLKPFSVLPSAHAHQPFQPTSWSCDVAVLPSTQSIELGSWEGSKLVKVGSLQFQIIPCFYSPSTCTGTLGSLLSAWIEMLFRNAAMLMVLVVINSLEILSG